MKYPLPSDESLVLFPATLLLFLQPVLAFLLPLSPRDRTVLLVLTLLTTFFVTYVLYRTAQIGLHRQYPSTPLIALIFNTAETFILHRYCPAFDLFFFTTVAASGALWGLRAGLTLSGLAAAGYTITVLLTGPHTLPDLLALAIFDLLLIVIGGITGLLATQNQKRRAQLEERMVAAAAELRQAQNLKDNLYEMIMHDLKSPLGTMISALHTLREIIPESEQAAHTALRAALKAGERQITLLENLLDLRRLEAGALPLTLEPLDLGPLIHSLVEQLIPRADRKSIQVEENVPVTLPLVHADRLLLTRVVANLLDNAHKFTPRHGRITITAEAGPEAVRVIVADTGPGVPAPDREVIFEKYRQVITGEAGARDGTGLGLAFCKMALQAHGGQISVSTSPGGGAQFEIRLPLQRNDADPV